MKNKWLIGLLSIIMAVMMCAGVAACKDPAENNGGTKTDAEIAAAAVRTINGLYTGMALETPVDYEVIGQTSVDGTLYAIEWTVSSSAANYSDYVSVGQMDAETKKVKITVTKADEPIEYKLKATVKVGEAADSVEFSHKIPAKAKDAAGTKDDPFSAERVIEIANTLEANDYYGGKDNPTRVYVKGYVVDIGTEFNTSRISNVYIVDEYDVNKDKSSPGALQIYSITYDDVNLTCKEDLRKGAEIIVSGYIELYQKNSTSDKTPEITYSGNNNVLCEYLEKAERTPQGKVELALSKVNESMVVGNTGDLELPVSVLKDVTFTWTSADSTYKITADGKSLSVPELPAEDKEVVLTLTATCGEATGTKTVTVTIKKAIVAEEGSTVFDFSAASQKNGSGLNDASALELFKAAASSSAELVSVGVTNMYDGNGTGGAKPNTAGLLKAGKSGGAGQLVLTFNKNVTKLVINCHDFHAASAQYATNSNKISVNGSEDRLLPYNETGAGEDMEFTLSTPATVVTIDFKDRALIYKITVTFGEGGSEPGPGPEPGPGNDYGTVENPLTVSEVIALAGTIVGNDYLGGADTPIQIYAKGIVVKVDGWDDTHNDWTKVYIAETAGAATSEQVQVYRLELDDQYLKTKEDLVVGATITLCGWLQAYNGKAEISYNKKTNENVTAVAYDKSTVSTEPVPTDPGIKDENGTITFNVGNYATAQEWENEKAYGEVALGENVTVKATGTPLGDWPLNTGKYYSSNQSWRIYQNESCNLTFTAKTGYELVSIKITYSAKNNGILVYGETQYKSGSVISVNSATATFTVAQTTVTSSANGNIQITEIEVVYKTSGGSVEPQPSEKTATYDPSSKYSENTLMTTETVDDVTLTFDKNGGTDPQYYQNGTAIRAYAKNKITVSVPDGKVILKITLTFGSSDGTNEITADGGSYSDGVWTGSAQSVTFTIGGEKGNRRIAKIVVEYASAPAAVAVEAPAALLPGKND